MQPNQDYKQLLTDVIKKQIVILGPDITLSKARNVKGLTVADDGTVTAVDGSPQEITQALIDQFVQLSGLIVKKTMEPLLVAFPDGTPAPAVVASTVPIQAPAPIAQTPVQTVQPTTQPTTVQAPAPVQAAPATQPTPAPAPASTSNATETNTASPTPQQSAPQQGIATSPVIQTPVQTPAAAPQPAPTETKPTAPADNPLAA